MRHDSLSGGNTPAEYRPTKYLRVKRPVRLAAANGYPRPKPRAGRRTR